MEGILLTQLRLCDLFEKLALHVADSLRESIRELLKILFVKEEFVLFVLLLSHALALGDRDIKVFFRLRRLHVKEVRALASTNPTSEDLFFVTVLQGAFSFGTLLVPSKVS
jgi:hypothetical protein